MKKHNSIVIFLNFQMKGRESNVQKDGGKE